MALLTTLISLAFATAPTSDSLHCVLTGDVYDKPAETIDYKGVRYGTCCGGCGSAFLSTPDQILAKDAKSKNLIGVSLFDPVSGERIEAKATKPSSNYKGVKYYFASAAEKTTFDAKPASFTATPAKEVMHCPVEGDDIANYASAGGYVDAGGVRYYVCCAGCLGAMHKDAAKYTGKVASYVKAAKAEKVKTS